LIYEGGVKEAPRKMEKSRATAHRSVLVKDFLTKNNVTALGHPHYSPDLAAADFYLFSRMKYH
jgi:transposase